MKDRRTGPRSTPRRLAKLGGGGLLFLAAAEAALIGILSLVARRSRQIRGGFPREEQPEVELESSGERLKLYLDYDEAYGDMLEEIGRAEERIFIETFTWSDDETGRRFVEALARKAREGVEVYAVFDELANLGCSSDFKRFPEEINHLRFRPVSGPSSALNPFNLLRDHRKILAVDGRVAFLGGCNIGGEYLTGWRDTHMRVRGDSVREIEDAFAGFWNLYRTPDLPEVPVGRESRAWNPTTSLRTNDPSLGLFPIRDMYLGAINRASERVYLESVYFVPSRRIKLSLMDAARRGVDVRVLLPKRSKYALADWLARRHFGELLEAGVRVFEYDERFVNHSKTLTVDGAWSTVGSANVDSLSLFGLHEINLEIYSERFAARMQEVFELDETASEEVTPEGWRARPLAARLVEKALAPLRPFG